MANDMNLEINITGNNEAGTSIDGMNSALSRIGEIANNLTRDFQLFMETVVSAFTDAGRAAENLTRPLSELGTDATRASELARSIAEVGTEARNATEQIDHMNQAANRRSGGGHGESGGRTEALFGNEMQNNAMYAGMAMAVPAAGAIALIKSSMGTFGQFSQAMANINSMMGLSQDQLTKLSNKVLDLSKNVPGGPVALSQALYGIVGAGVPAADQMDVLATAAKAATAGQTDVSTATSALISVMDSYGLKGKDVAKISDEMFAANAAGAMTFDSFAKSIGTVAGPAAQAGVSFDQVAAATAALTNQGLDAQRATEGLRALMVGIMAPTAGATKEAKKLGIEWDANALKSKGMAGMINEAMKATHGNSQELKKLIPNIAAWTAAVDLGGKGADSFKQAMDTMGQSAGATNKALEEQEKGYQEKMNKMTAAIQRAQIAFASGFAPVISDIANKVGDLANKFAGLSPNIQKIIGYVTLGAAAFLTLGSAFFMTLSGIGALVKGFEGLAGALKVVTGAETLMEALSPVGWVIAITASVVAVGVLIYQHWSQIKVFLQNAWNSIKTTAEKIWSGLTTSIGNFVTKTVTTIRKIWNGAINWISTAAQDFVNIPVKAFEWLYNHNYYFKDLVDFIRKAWNIAKSDAEIGWNTIKSWLTNLWNGIVSAGKSVWNTLTSFFSGLWHTISSGVSSAWNGIKNTISKLVNDAINAIKKPFNDLGSFFSDLWSKAEKWGAGIINGVVNGINSAASSIGSAISSAVSSAASFLGFHSNPPAKNAKGGIYDRPLLSWVAEAGPEAIIPLSDPSRGLALWQQAGQMLGVLPSTSSMALSVGGGMALPGGSGGGNVYHITVHANGNITRNERELADIVSRGILEKTKMQGRI